MSDEAASSEEKQQEAFLRITCGNRCNSNVFRCPTCGPPTKLARLASITECYPTWCVELQCEEVHTFYICRICVAARQRKPWVLFDNIQKHHEAHHRNERMSDMVPPPQPPEAEANGDDDMVFGGDDVNPSGDDLAPAFPVGATLVLNETTLRPHWHVPDDTVPAEDTIEILFGADGARLLKHHQKNKQGFNYLVAQSLFKNGDLHDKVSPQAATIAHEFAQLCLELSAPGQALLASLVDNIVRYHESPTAYAAPDQEEKAGNGSDMSNESDDHRKWKIAVPRTYLDIRRDFTEYPKSLLQSIPSVPQMDLIENTVEVDTIKYQKEVTYVPPQAALQFMLAYGVQIQFPNQAEAPVDGFVRSMYESVPAREFYGLCAAEALPLVGTLWGDDAEMNTCKTTRGSCSAVTLTLGRLDDERNSFDNTLPIVLGLKGDKQNRTEFETRLYGDLKELEKPHVYWVATLGIYLWIRVKIIGALFDRLERDVVRYRGAHNGRYTALSKHVGDLQCILPSLRACESCVEARLRNNIATTCSSCADWCLESPMFSVPDNSCDVPIGCDPPNVLQKVEFTELVKTVKKAIEEVLRSNLDADQAKTFLVRFGVRTGTAESIAEFATSHIPADSTTPVSEDYISSVLSSSEELILPFVWHSDFCCNDYIDVIMHLLFLGIVKATTLVLEQVLTLFRKKTDFRKRDGEPNKLLLELYRECVEWLKGQEFGGKKFHGGWISDNFVNFCRVYKFEFSYLLTVSANTPAKVKILELSKKLVSALTCMVSRIMQRQSNEASILDLDRHIKIFLSVLHELDDALSDKVSVIATKPNLACLLYLANEFRHFGPLRNFWDGGPMGEGIFRFLKPLINSGVTRSGWSRSAMRQFYRRLGMKHLTRMVGEQSTFTEEAAISNDYLGDDLDSADIAELEKNREERISEESCLEDTEERKRRQRYSLCRRYRDRDEIIQRLNDHRLLTGIRKDEGVLLVLTKGDECFELRVTGEQETKVLDCSYFVVALSNTPVPGLSAREQYEKSQLFFCSFALPDFKRVEGNQNSERWIIASDWTEQYAPGKFGLPRLSFADYDPR